MAALHKKHFLVGCLSSLIGTFASFPALAAELTVQIGAFGDQPGPGFAERAAEFGELLVFRGDDGVTRVTIGRYNNRTAAGEALKRLQIAGYKDAYISNARGGVADREPAVERLLDVPDPASSTRFADSRPIPAAETSSATADRRSTATLEQPPVVGPKQPTPASDSTVSQAGRFRLRTHDTQSGKTSDLQFATADDTNPNTAGGLPAGAPVSDNNEPAVAGMGVNRIPQHLRDKLVYLDGLPHIKDGDRFIPLNDALNNSRP